MIYAYLQETRDRSIASVVALGAPSLTTANDTLRRLLSVVRLLRWVPWLPLAALARGVAPLSVGFNLNPFVFHGHNTSLVTIRRALATSFDDVNVASARQLYDCLAGERAIFEENSGLSAVDTPSLFIVGSADRIAPSRDCRHFFDTLSSESKCLQTLGRTTGAAHDYGHGDLLLGSLVRQECYPHIALWINGGFEVTAGEEVQTVALPDTSLTLSGPYGLLNLYSPTRRRRWYEQRRRLEANSTRA